MRLTTLTLDQARKKLARYRTVDRSDLHILALLYPPTGIKAALLFGVEAVTGLADGSEYEYTFGVFPPSALTEWRPLLSLDLTIKNTTRRIGLLFTPEAVAALAGATFLLLLSGDQPEWLNEGTVMDILAVTKLLENGNLDVDLQDSKVKCDLAQFGAAVIAVDCFATRGVVH